MQTRIDEEFAISFVRRLHEAVNAHDASGVAALCAPGVVWHDPAALEPLRGREAVLGFHRDRMFRSMPDVRVTLLQGPYLAVDRTSIAVRLAISGTMSGPLDPPGFGPTGGRLEFETAEFSEFEGPLLSRHRVVLDMLALGRQIGAVPQNGSLGEHVGVWVQRLAAWRGMRPPAAG